MEMQGMIGADAWRSVLQDAFGSHAYDTKAEHAMDAIKGKHHTEWRST